jgi:hypothetical protein
VSSGTTVPGKPPPIGSGLRIPTGHKKAGHVVEPDGTASPLPAITSYSVTEEATPLTPDDTSGAVGGFTIAFDQQGVAPHQVKAYRRKVLNFDDLGQGRITGIVETAGSSQGRPQLTVQSRLNLLAAQRTAAPYAGDMLGYLTYVLGLCGITDMTTVYVDPDLAVLPVSVVGWYQPVWTQLKKLASIYHFEIALVSDQIVFRKLRTRIGEQYRDSLVDWAINDTNLAQHVVVNYYETVTLAPGTSTKDPNGDHPNVAGYYYPQSADGKGLGGLMEPTYEQAIGLGLVYPPGGWDPKVQILSVNANETKEVQIALGASVSSIRQPEPVRFVGPYQVPSHSVYTVTDRNADLVDPYEWTKNGGSVRVKINPDTITATVTITGCGEGFKGPFTLSLKGGGSDFSTLRLIGEGVAYRKKSITAQTGLTPDLAQNDVGTTVDNEFVTSEEQAWEVMQRVLPRYLGAAQTIQVTTTGINRLGDSGGYDFQPLSWLEGLVPAGMTVADIGAWLNTQSGGTDLRTISAWIALQSAGDFSNQAFGNVAGARVRFDGSWYRIVSATITADAIQYVAALDMTCGDISADLPAGATVATLSAAFAGKTVMDWDARPVPESLSA